MLLYVYFTEKETLVCNVVIDTDSSNSGPSSNGGFDPKSQWFVVGSITVTTDSTWQQVESSLSAALLTHFNEVYQGLRTKKTVVKTEVESPDAQNMHLSLGVSLNSVKYCGIGKCTEYSSITQ